MVPLLHELLQSPDADTRARSALVLGQIACPSSLDPLAAGLEDPARTVRVQCGIALGCMGDPRGTATCSYALISDPTWIRFYAIYGLWSINTDRAKTALRTRQVSQTGFIAEVLRSALQTPYVAPEPVPPLSPRATTEPRPSLQQLWEQAADVFVNESDWWFHGGDYDQVIRASEPSILLDPEYVETYSVVAWLQWSMGNDATAIRTLRRGVAAAAANPEAHFNLGYHYFNTKRYTQALPSLERAVKLGGDMISRRTYAHCLERLGRLRESLDCWESILKTDPTDGVANLNRDRVKAKLEAGDK